ncbi:MAG: BlaI/MecI/CopY family transcriptional regulator [Chloroflexi bacterium]|nr:BlaI/MecI/CopY family transcriptional regulator [Chloroflexota bacterium]
MSEPTRSEPDVLGPLERRVMAELWAHGPQTVGEVLDALNRSVERQVAYTTAMTILVRLFEKGYVTRAKEARAYRYTASLDEAELRAQVGRRQLHQLIERYGAASVAGFASALGESDVASRLRDLARERPGR